MKSKKIDTIIRSFSKEHGISEEETKEVIEICRRKIQLTGQTEDYILLLLPDELKNYCIRNTINAITLDMMNKEENCKKISKNKSIKEPQINCFRAST